MIKYDYASRQIASIEIAFTWGVYLLKFHVIYVYTKQKINVYIAYVRQALSVRRDKIRGEQERSIQGAPLHLSTWSVVGEGAALQILGPLLYVPGPELEPHFINFESLYQSIHTKTVLNMSQHTWTTMYRR